MTRPEGWVILSRAKDPVSLLVVQRRIRMTSCTYWMFDPFLLDNKMSHVFKASTTTCRL